MSSDHPPIRPPSEADSILLRLSTGCSHNKCSFCPAYKSIPFTLRSEQAIENSLKHSCHLKHKTNLFLCDGDALVAPQTLLLTTFEKIKRITPWVKRVGTYANAKAIATKSDKELKALREAGLKIVHLGLESGDDCTLNRVMKWGTSSQIIEQAKRLKNADIKLFVTVLLGLGGTERSLEHARRTGEALTSMDPNYIGALTLIPCDNTQLMSKIEQKTFSLPGPEQMLLELKVMLENTQLSRGIFYANHASNYLPLRVRMPREKENALKLLDQAIHNNIPLKPEWMRAL
ncbi:radical SAM protein [Chitinispirillales bacterium ANBcel5]|uniref:radical SAM protein n=1 Tax=Cellulosispirillum alkaliphilum TaxID=3039283 RepID=UPI002A559FC4|nr:radical SAM protein [Chitinispirillales bacterium ANBcel5]